MSDSNSNNKVIINDYAKNMQDANPMQSDADKSILNNKMGSFVYRRKPQLEEIKTVAGKLRKDIRKAC